MKTIFLIITLVTSIFSAENFKKVLCSHPWEVEYRKTIMGTDDPNATLPLAEIDSVPPLCGQIITFKEDYTCQIENRGKGIWSEVDKCNWSIDKWGNLRFRNKGGQFQYGFSLSVLNFNKDSIIFYIQDKGIESGTLSVTLHKLKKITGSGKGK